MADAEHLVRSVSSHLCTARVLAGRQVGHCNSAAAHRSPGKCHPGPSNTDELAAHNGPVGVKNTVPAAPWPLHGPITGAPGCGCAASRQTLRSR